MMSNKKDVCWNEHDAPFFVQFLILGHICSIKDQPPKNLLQQKTLSWPKFPNRSTDIGHFRTCKKKRWALQKLMREYLTAYGKNPKVVTQPVHEAVSMLDWQKTFLASVTTQKKNDGDDGRGHEMTYLGGIKQCKCMVCLGDFLPEGVIKIY